MVYRYDIRFQGGTPDQLPISQIYAEYPSEEAFLDDMKTQVTPIMPSMIEQAFADQGITVSVIASIYSRGWLEYINSDVKFHFEADATITTETRFFASPIAPLMVIAIGIAIALIVATIIIAPAIADWLRNSNVEKWEVTEYGWVLDPNTGRYVWVPIKTEKGESPTLISQLTPLLVLGGFGLLALYFGGQLISKFIGGERVR